MKYLIAGLLLAIVSIPVKAEARQRGYHHVSHHYGRYLAHRHWRHLNRRYAHRIKHFHRTKTHIAYRTRETLPGPCHTAAAMGGPCGCWTAWNLLGRLDHVWKGVNLWLADDWARAFRRVDPAPGTAAVWPHRHVAPVVAVNRDGTVTVRDYWATRRVQTAGLIFVDPLPRRRTYQVAGAWPL